MTKSTRFLAFSRWPATLGLLVALLAGTLATDAVAQTRSSTASQAETFRNLTPEQQKAVLEQLGTGTAGGRRDEPLEFPSTMTSKAARDAAEEKAAFEVEREPEFKPGDTVVIEVSIRPRGEDDFEKSLAEAQTRPQAAAGTQAGTTREQEPKMTAEERLKRREEQRKLKWTPEELAELEAFRDRLRDGNPYKLDEAGMLRLPGVRDIPLAGLTDWYAAKRISTEPALRNFRIRMTLLPLERQGVDAVKPFGYDIFEWLPNTFAPVSDVPVPSDYVIGPGDMLEVQLFGNTQGEHTLTVGRDGKVQFPDLGPIPVAGMRFSEARQAIESRVTDQMIGTRVVVGMGELRSISVFVTGDAEQPGSFSISSLSTVSSALFASGGVRETGSMRKIQVKRRGQVIATLDLYDLLLNGDSRADVRLSSGDVIFIPPIGRTVGVTGQVRRPAVYELLDAEATAGEALRMAGGLTPEADPRSASLERIGERRERNVMAVDLSAESGRATPLRSGDLLRVNAVPRDISNAIQVLGHVQNPGPIAWRPGLRIADVLRSVEDLRPRADLNYVLIRREEPGHQVTALSADLARAWVSPASEANVPLKQRDQLYVFNLEGGRELQIKAFVEDLERQAEPGQPTQLVSIGGPVKAPGKYPLELGMTVADLIRAGGGLNQKAYAREAELTRYEVVNGEFRQVATVPVDLERLMAGDVAADLVLTPSDFLLIKPLPQWSQEEMVELKGEVRFPGKYPIRRGETLSELLKRAGGFTDLAFVEGSVFTRESLKQREAQQIESLANRMEGDLAALALQSTQSVGPTSQGASPAQALAIGQSLLDNLRQIEPVGRLVINLDRVLVAEAGDHNDIVLKDGDRLLVPARMQEVTVLGEVQSGTSHLWDPSLTRDDYVNMSGGMTQKADGRRVYVVRANGSVMAGNGSAWFRNGNDEIRPGDTIVVPLDAERMRPLPLWTAVSSIIFNMAVAVAAVNSF
jgi:protein involved in polysaccharide export with SLBB domain